MKRDTPSDFTLALMWSLVGWAVIAFICVGLMQ